MLNLRFSAKLIRFSQVIRNLEIKIFIHPNKARNDYPGSGFPTCERSGSFGEVFANPDSEGASESLLDAQSG
jgi:hypothetical protein